MPEPIQQNKPVGTTLSGCERPGNLVLQPRLSEAELEAMALIFKAISHPVRLKLLDLIAQGEGEVCSCEIERFFDLTQPTISHHLKLLNEAGLIASEPRGVWVYHRICPQALDTLRQHLAQYTTLAYQKE
jgi:ArsR family transcriptional regulator, arsenate/arsenite/antimonite-responsive transcriptional repressor